MSNSRRQFLSNACALCAAAALAPMDLLAAPDKKKKKKVKLALKDGKVIVPITLLENRLNSFKVKGLTRELLIVRNPESYSAIFMRCTHMGIGLNIDGEELVCPAHKSIFDDGGKVLKGPAKTDLQVFNVETDLENVIVLIPEAV